jgi:hypothetical protein
MDQTAGDMEGEKAQRPEDEQDDSDGQKHWLILPDVARVTVNGEARSNALD